MCVPKVTAAGLESRARTTTTELIYAAFTFFLLVFLQSCCILAVNMCYVPLLCFSESGKRKVFGQRVQNSLIPSLSWPWIPALPSVTVICTLSARSNLRPLSALLNKRGDWRQKDPLGLIKPCASQHHLIDARSSQEPIRNAQKKEETSKDENVMFMMQN